MLIAQLALVGGYLEIGRPALAQLLGIKVDAVTKTLQRLAGDGVELRVPYTVGVDGRPVYGTRDQPLRLQLPDTDLDPQPGLDPQAVDQDQVGPATVDTRVDSSQPTLDTRADKCPTCGNELPGRSRADICPPLAKPALRSSEQAGPARSRTARPLRTGGYRDWDRRANRTRFRCDQHAHLPASDPGEPCPACKAVRQAAEAAAAARRKPKPTGPVPQRPLWPAAVSASASGSAAAAEPADHVVADHAADHDCDTAGCAPATCPNNRLYGGNVHARAGPTSAATAACQ